ncbi:MAG: DUF5807 family protein [Halobacteriota archaeon]
MSNLAAYLAGDRLDDVAIFVSEAFMDENMVLANYGEDVDGGVVLIVDGEEGRAAFSQGTGIDPMRFAGAAMDREGYVEPDLSGGVCPAENESGDRDEEGDDSHEHTIEFVFSFAEAQNEDVGGIYADGDVIHAYAHCSCGENFNQKWIAGSRE